jgi:hypothetical protein
MSDHKNACDYGAVGDGVTDDTAALRAWLSALSSGCRRGYLPSGDYLCDPLPISGPMHIYGDGATSRLLPRADGVCVNTPDPVKLSDFAIHYPSGSPIGSRAICLDCADGPGSEHYGNSRSVLRDLHVYGAQIAVDAVNAVAFTIDNVDSIHHTSCGIRTQNVRHPDAGDGTISDCYLQGLPTSYGGIVWGGSGALAMVGNKILTHQYGVVMLLPDGAVTRQIMISANTIDGASVAGAAFWPLGSTGSFGGVTIAGNVFNLCHIGLSAPLPPRGQWISSVADVGNNWCGDGLPGQKWRDTPAVISAASAGNTIN